MCGPTTNGTTARAPPKRKHSLLLTTESFRFDGDNTDDAAGKKKDGGGTYYDEGGDGTPNCVPTMPSTLLTIAVVVLVLLGFEMGIRAALERMQDYDPIFQVELNRQVLARHIGVDAAACFMVAYIGLKNSHLLGDIVSHTLGRSDSMPEAGYERRVFTYHPAGQQVLLFFFAYQVKNMYDTIVWNDGIVFVIHHLLAGATAWGAMYPGFGHMYAIFFMGISEVSTAVLCLLANFDDEFGVVGLGAAFPNAKIVLGAIFAVLFVVCRTLIWPVASHHFLRDCRNAIKNDSPMVRQRKKWIQLFMFCNIGLSLLQVVFLGQIIWTVKEEVSKML